MNRLDLQDLSLFLDGKKLKSVYGDKRAVGFCVKCGQELESLGYFKPGSGWLLAAQCRHGHSVLISYDDDWRWLEDADLEIGADQKSILEMSREQLEVVFSPGEIKAMEAVERGEVVSRQNLYRARAKYDKFERLFGIRIRI
jgi:hypothetical protein